MAKKPYDEKTLENHANNLHELKDRIKSGNTGGVYIFYGDEEYTKNHYSKLLSEKAGSTLNTKSFYGDEFTLPDFIAACETSAVESFDMFSIMDDEEENANSEDSALRIVKLFSPDLSDLSKSDCDYFFEFLRNLDENTIVIFWFYDGQIENVFKPNYKKIMEFALTINFRREPVSSSILITWILRHFSKAKLNVDRHVAVHLCQTVGNSMTDLKNEIDKLIEYLNYENRDTLTKEDIDFICIKSTNAQIFEISNHALSCDFTKAARALNVLRDKREKPVFILGTISKSINDICVTDTLIKQGITIPVIAKKLTLPEFVIKNYSAILTKRNLDFKGKETFCDVCSRICLEYDTKLKSSRTDGYELLLELIFKLSFAGRKSF